MQPRDWCDPREAFGDPNAPSRVWQPPVQPHRMPDFFGAVVQHAVAISVRRYKNAHGVTQDDLATRDGRPDALNKWNARLNGRIGLTPKDLAVIVRVLPGALPREPQMRLLMDVASKARPRPARWTEVDS